MISLSIIIKDAIKTSLWYIGFVEFIEFIVFIVFLVHWVEEN